MKNHFQQHKRLYLALFGALIGALVFFLFHTVTSLNVTDDSWILRGYVERDIIQHYTGWLFYRDAPLGFPLGVAENLGYPFGGAIAFSDSIPLLSVFFCFFANILPTTFQFFGIYVFLSYVLAGVSASLLLSLFLDNLPSVLIGSALFCLSPIMAERAFRHTALTCQFLILFALYLYFKNRKEGFRFRVGYLILSFLAVSIHFYFVPMILAILLADLLQQSLETKKWLKNGLFLLGNIAAVFASAFLFGYFYRDAVPSGSFGYGYFTMNLNSLFNPRSVSGLRWSLLLPQLGQGLGSAEGFNYLGLGVLLVLFGAAVYYLIRPKKKELFAIIKRHRALLIVSILLTLFAVSTTVVINNNAYLKLDLPVFLLKLASTFRSSGRLFWPVYNLLFLFSIVFLNQKFSKKWAPYALAVLLLVQSADLVPAIKAKRDAFRDPMPALMNTTDDAFFTENRDSFQRILTFSDEGVFNGLLVANYAIENGMLTNEPFLARNDIAAYHDFGNAEYQKLISGEPDPDTLYLFGDVNLFFNAAVALGDSAMSGRIDYPTGSYFVIAPKSGRAVVPSDSAFVSLSDLPLTTAFDLSDLTWTNGVLNDNPSVVSFYDNAFTRSYLETADYLIFEGTKIKILEKDYGDPGWVMVTLDVEDASVLSGKPLETA